MSYDGFKRTSAEHAKALQKALKHLKGLIVLYSIHGPRTWPDTAEPQDLEKFADACLDLARWKAVVRADEEIAAQRKRREQLEARKGPVLTGGDEGIAP